jgi:hypothetical protein
MLAGLTSKLQGRCFKSACTNSLARRLQLCTATTPYSSSSWLKLCSVSVLCLYKTTQAGQLVDKLQLRCCSILQLLKHQVSCLCRLCSRLLQEGLHSFFPYLTQWLLVVALCTLPYRAVGM